MEEKKKRGRPPKPKMATPEQIKEIDSGLQQLGIANSLDDFMNDYLDDNKRKQFSQTLVRQLQEMERISLKAGTDGSLQPQLSQGMLQNISFRSLPCTSEQLESWLQNGSAYSSNIQNVSYWLQTVCGQYRNLILDGTATKAFHTELLPLTKDKKVLKLLKKLNIKYQLQKIDRDVMMNGTSFYWINETEDSIMLIKLPSDYCYIVSEYDYGWVFVFDLTFFDRFLGLESAIPELYSAYQELVKLREKGLAGKNSPIQYYSVDPITQGVCFSYNHTPDKLPPYVSSLGSALDILSYKDLLKNNVILSMYRILSLGIPLTADKKPSIQYSMASEITSVIQSTLPPGVLCFSSPFTAESINVDQTTRLGDIVDLGNNNFASSAGLGDAFFGASGVIQSTALSFLWKINFERASSFLYSQYENFINLLIKTRTTCKSRVKIFGDTVTDQEKITAYANLVRTANMPMGHLLSYYYEPYEIMSVLEAEDELGIKDLMKPIQSAFNSKSIDIKEGRPTKQEDQLAESGITTRDYESNDN